MNNKPIKTLIMGKAVNCFAFRDNGCCCLTVAECENCKFYKTNEQLKEEQELTKIRLAKLELQSIYSY